ncbi:MAG: TonB-dependent receptor [Gammaproteobacteria bacterium]|nr:TonB-dependent receptor [Pseudomonadales bacterium]MCP5348200.1 TonB-dependent receptor [Pseudomonadales bacterium]
MFKKTKQTTVLVPAILMATLLPHAPIAFGQQDVVEEVVVTGSRRAPRTALESAAPIDVFGANDFQDQGTPDLNNLLRNLVPSYNVDTQEINDSNSLVRPSTLRGLPADDTLVLVNNKRRHRSAAVQFGRQGTHFPDISQIPPIALRQVEVLRDGAAAQYGSDAIAGVVNFLLKENNSGISLETKQGEHTDYNDGELSYVAGNIGLPLGDDGFFSFSFDVVDQNKTDRARQRDDAQALIAAGNTYIRTDPYVMERGLADTNTINLFYNSGITLSDTQEIYSFGSYSERETDLGFFYRNPESRGGIFTKGSNQLFIDETGNGSGDCPVIPTGIDPVTGITSSIAGRAAGLADPDCFTFLEWFPGGYTPDFGAGIRDMSEVAGIRGEIGETTYDVSLGAGFSEVTYRLSNTVNASMGSDSPTSFEPGIYTTVENNLNIDLVTPFEIDGLFSPLSVGYGFELRREIFKVTSKDEYSYLIGPYARQGANVGSDGFQGFGPQQHGTWDRKNWAIYVDLEADVTERLLLGAALRYEDFYNTFGDTTNGKVTARYRLTDAVNLRATYGTGFRAPSPGQANISNISTGINADTGEPQAEGQIPPTNPIAQRFGGKQLGPEESVNLSIGVTAQIGDLDLSVDYFQIELTDRILNSGDVVITPEIAAELAASGISGAGNIVEFTYYTNDMDTTNKGVEIVGAWDYSWGDLGTTTFQGSWAWMDQKIDKVTPGLLNRSNLADLTDGIPANRGNFRAYHNIGDWRFLLSANYYDEYLIVPSSGNPARDYWADPEIIWNGEVSYTWNNRYEIIVGADNIFNTYPGKVRPIDQTSSTSNIYVNDAAFSGNGAFWYLRLRADFDL